MSSRPHSPPTSDQREATPGSEKDDVDDEDPSKLPAHIQSVRDGLLDFNHFIGLRAAMLIAEEKDEDVIPLSAYKPDCVGKPEQARESEFVESAQRLVADAQNVDPQNRHEWYKLFRAVMTGRMDSAHYVSNVHKSIAWANNENWLATATLDQPKSPTTTLMTGLYFGFPVQEADQRAATGFKSDSSFDNYTREQLAKLTTQGLNCVLDVPSSVDETMAQTTSKKPQPQLICFPWGIFEAHGDLKSPEVNEVSFAIAVSQVSAAASTALSMFERLAKFADERHDGQHISPVIAITSVGANTTVWLAYCDIVDDKFRDHKMISIWEGTITKIWDAIQFCRIIDNLFFWAQHCLKPKVTHFLSQWRLRYCPNVPNIYSLLEMDTETAEIVHKAQDRLSSLGLSPNEDLPALVRQAVVLREVMRSSNIEVKADSASKEEKKHLATVISLPSRPRASSLEAAPSSSTESRQGTSPKIRPKGKEIPHQDSDVPAEKSEKDTAESSKSHNTHMLQLKSPPKHQTAFPVFPDKDKKSTSENSIALEDIKTASTDVLTNTQTLNSKRPTISEVDWTGNNKILVFNPRQIKTSSAEERKSPLPGLSKELNDANLNFVQRTLRSMATRVENGHVLPLEKQKRRNLDLLLEEKNPRNIKIPSSRLPRKVSDKKNSANRLSPSPSPFISETFKVSFEVLLDLDMTGPSVPITHRHGPYPTLRVEAMEYVEYPWGTDLHSYIRRKTPAQQPSIIEPLPPLPASPLKTRIPWKDKYIIVRLPPVSPASVSIERKSDSPAS